MQSLHRLLSNILPHEHGYGSVRIYFLQNGDTVCSQCLYKCGMLYEFKADLNAYLAGLGPSSPVKTLADVIAFNEKNADRELRYFGQEIMLMAEKKGPLTTPAYRKALAGTAGWRGRSASTRWCVGTGLMRSSRRRTRRPGSSIW
jgi:hypothetical protein